MSIPLTILCSALAAEVVLPKRAYEALLPAADDPAEESPGPRLTRRWVRIEQVETSIRVEVRWTVHTERPGWLELPLPDPSFWAESATWNGESVALRGMRDGSRRLLVRVEGPGEVRLVGELPGELRRGVRLVLPEAAVGTVQVVTQDPEIEVTGDGRPAVEARGVRWTGASELTISTQKQIEARERARIVVARSGLGLTVGDGSVAVQARLVWAVRIGALDEVRFRAPSVGPDLVVTGENVAEWSREGDVVRVVLSEPVEEVVELRVGWSQSLPNTDEMTLPLPVLEPLQVFRTEYAVQLARDGDREVVPELGSWTAVAHQALPDVGKGLIQGTPTSSWTSSSSHAVSGAQVGLYRFQPVAGPATLVDVAAYDAAYSEDGRMLLRAHYAVRNDRGAFLEVTLPPGMRLVSARVQGEPARLARRGEQLLIPLAKSLETVQGLLSFPITLVMLHESTGFEKLDERGIELPRLGAEVARTQLTLSLPPGWKNRIPVGEQFTVAGFDEGDVLTYGFSAGDANVAVADRLYQDALRGWMDNDFDGVQDRLDTLRDLGGDNENVRRLQSNLDVISGKDESRFDVTLSNRVKEQAQARSSEQQKKQGALLKEAEEAFASGDYDKAEASYRSAGSIGRDLERLEVGGSVENKSQNAVIKDKLSKARAFKKRKGKQAPAAAAPPPAAEPSTKPISEGANEDGDKVVYDETTVIDFEAEEVTGTRVKPSGSLLLNRIVSDDEMPWDEPAPLDVTASNLDIVIPAYGETVRYQRLLTRAGEPVALRLRAKRWRRR